VTFAVVALTAAPNAAAAGRSATRPQPHATATSSTVTDGRGHNGHGKGTTAPPGNPESKQSPTTVAPQPRTATASPSAPTDSPPRSTVSGGPSAAPAPTSPAAAPVPSPSSASGQSGDERDSTWRRLNSEPVDRSITKALTTGLKNAGSSAGFPALLIGVMVAFLLVQHRLDKRDVKLSQADWASDHGLEFSAPSTIQPTIQR
jgi:hypothetical protein